MVTWLHTPFFTYVACCVTVNGEYQKSKKIATDSNYLRCHALLTALHFPLETTWSCKQDRKERYWGQQFWQMERDISVRPTEMTRPVTVDHLQSWSRIFRSDQTEMVRSIWWTNRNFRTFGLNGKRPQIFRRTSVQYNSGVQTDSLYNERIQRFYNAKYSLVRLITFVLFQNRLLLNNDSARSRIKEEGMCGNSCLVAPLRSYEARSSLLRCYLFVFIDEVSTFFVYTDDCGLCCKSSTESF